MKKIQLLAIALGLITLLSACHYGRGHVIISTDDGSSRVRIEYYGQVAFNAAKTAISYISPRGYVRYEKDDERIDAYRNRNGQIVYRINGGDKKIALDDNDRLFVAEAVKEMVKRGHYDNGHR